MLESISTVLLATSVKASIAIESVSADVVPRCEWVNAIQGDGEDPIRGIIENLYGLVLEYLPLVVIAIVIALAATIAFAVRRKVIAALIPAIFALVLIGSVVGAVTNVGGASPC